MSTLRNHSLSPRGMVHFINDRDHALMHRIHDWSAPRWIRLIMVAASRGGDGWLWYPLGVVILLFGDHDRFAAVFAGISSAGLGLWIYGIVKKKTRRLRPCLVEPIPWAAILPPDQYSFPSGHTIVSFAIAASVGLFYPVLMTELFVCAVLIATSRILLGMHFLSDVAVGMLIGTSLGYAAFLLLR